MKFRDVEGFCEGENLLVSLKDRIDRVGNLDMITDYDTDVAMDFSGYVELKKALDECDRVLQKASGGRS